MSTSKNNWFNYIFVKEQKYLVVIVAISLSIASYLGYLLPRYISDLYASYEKSGVFETVFQALIIIFVIEYFNQVVYYLSINRYMQQMIQHIRSKSYSNWLLSYEAIGSGDSHKYPMGEVLARLISDTEALMELVGSGSFKIFIDFAFIVSCLISFLTLNTTSGLALIMAEVVTCLLLLWGSKHMSKVYMAVRKSTGVMARVIANISGGFRFSYFTPNNKYASRTSLGVFEDFLGKQLKANVWDASYFSIAESLFPVLLALLVLVFPYSQITEMAVLAAIIDLIQRSIGPIKDISAKISSIQRAKTALIRIQEFNQDLTEQLSSNIHDDHVIQTLKTLDVDIKEFAYPEKREGESFTLKNIKFTGYKGDLIGIIGLSGSGKSTILKILSTDIICESAKMTVTTDDDQKMRFHGGDSKELASYKRQVSIVSQESHVFSESLFFNISLGQKSLEEFNHFWEDVKMKIPYLVRWGINHETKINPKELSLGQKQLLSALRSCFLVKPIVLFDEISSGLDSDLELALRELVLLIQKQSLTFIVAHRIETIVAANTILVIDKGALVDQGKHDELIKTSALYQDFIAQIKSLQ